MPRSDAMLLKNSITSAIQNYFLRIVNEDHKSDVFFLQVGANDGSMSDPLVHAVKVQQVARHPGGAGADLLRATQAKLRRPRGAGLRAGGLR